LKTIEIVVLLLTVLFAISAVIVAWVMYVRPKKWRGLEEEERFRAEANWKRKTEEEVRLKGEEETGEEEELKCQEEEARIKPEEEERKLREVKERKQKELEEARVKAEEEQRRKAEEMEQRRRQEEERKRVEETGDANKEKKPLKDELLDDSHQLLHPLRRRIMDLLAEKPMHVNELSRALGEERRLVSHHLDLLEERGFVESKYQISEQLTSKGEVTQGL